MSRIAYVNGRYLPFRQAMVHIEDRGYQFSDGVYEVCLVQDGHLIDERLHMTRLTRSLRELQIRWPVTPSALAVIMREVVARERLRDGVIYVQITRGVATRNHPFPPASVKPALVVNARPHDLAAGDRTAAEGIAVATMPDIRWHRVDIKTVSLVANVLAKEAAHQAGAEEAWLVDRDGYITEGSSTNAWILTPDGVLLTRRVGDGILRGVTREVLVGILRRDGIRFEERSFTVAEALEAREAFVTSAGNLVMPVVRIDGRPVANGHPGQLSLTLRGLFLEGAEHSSLRFSPGSPNMSD